MVLFVIKDVVILLARAVVLANVAMVNVVMAFVVMVNVVVVSEEVGGVAAEELQLKQIKEPWSLGVSRWILVLPKYRLRKHHTLPIRQSSGKSSIGQSSHLQI